MAQRGAKRHPVLPRSRGTPGGWWWVFFQAPCPTECPAPMGVPLGPVLPVWGSTPAFRAPHILLMTYGASGGSRQEVGWTLPGETWILIEKPSFIQSKERERKKTQPSCSACRQALLCCRQALLVLHPFTARYHRIMERISPGTLSTCADASGLCPGSLCCFDTWNYNLIKSSTGMGRRKWKVLMGLAQEGWLLHVMWSCKVLRQDHRWASCWQSLP